MKKSLVNFIFSLLLIVYPSCVKSPSGVPIAQAREMDRRYIEQLLIADIKQWGLDEDLVNKPAIWIVSGPDSKNNAKEWIAEGDSVVRGPSGGVYEISINNGVPNVRLR